MIQEKLNTIFQQNHDFKYYISQQPPQYLQSLGLLEPDMSIQSSQRAYINFADDTQPVQDSLVPQFMVGLALSSTVVNALLIKLKGGKASALNVFLLVVAISAMAVYQIQSIFGKDLKEKFIPYSTAFLSLNLLLFVLSAYISKIQQGKGITEFFEKNFSQSGKPIDRNRAGPLEDEIKKQSEDPNWKVSSEDLNDVITPLKVNKDDLAATFGGLIENKICLMLLKYLLLLSSVGVLALYAFVIYEYDNGNLLGMIIAISVFFLDCFNILRQANSENDVNTVFFMILNRVFLVSQGKNYWIYGFMILYIIYGSALAIQIAERRFPFDKDIVKKSYLGIHPSIFAFILSVVYFVLVICLKNISIQGVEISPLKPEGGQALDVVPASILSVFVCVTIYFIVSLARLFIRKAHKTQKESGYASLAKRCGCNHGLFSLTNLFIVLAFGSFVFWVFILYHYTKNTSLVIWGVTIPLIGIFYANGFTYLVLNDYSYLQNVTQLNKEIDVHNLKVLRNEKYKELIDQQIKENKLFIVDLPVVQFQPKQKLVFTEDKGKNLQAFQEKIKEFYTSQKDLKQGLIDKTIKSEEALDPTKTYLDIDEVTESQQGWHQTNDIRFKRVQDWRKDSTCCSAFLSRKLRPNDKGFIYNMIYAFIAWLSLLISLLAYKGQGIELVYPILYLGISLVIASSVIYQSRSFHLKEIVPWTILNLIYIGSLAGYFNIKFEQGIKTPGALSYVFFQILGVPTAVHGLIVLLRIIDRGVDKLQEFYFFIGIFIIGQVSIVICCFTLNDNKYVGIIYLAFVLFTIFAIRTVITFIRNGYELTNIQKIIFCIASIAFSLTPAVLSFGLTSLKPKQGLTYSTFIFFLMVCVYSVGSWIKDFNQSETKPVFCSRYLFPIYKFNWITKDIEPHNGPTYAWFLSLIVLVAWSVYYNSKSKDKQIGVSLSIIIETLILVSAILFSSQTILLIDDANYKIDEGTFKQTWLELKKRFFKEINASQSSSCDSYYNLWMKEYFLKSYSQTLNNQSPNEIPSIISQELNDSPKFEAGNLDSQKQYFQKKIQEMFKDKGSQLSDLSSVLVILSDLQQKVQKSYEKEIQLIIRLIILSFYNSVILKEYEMQKFIRFVKDKEGIFMAFGIKLTVTPQMSILEQYEQVQTQIDSLNTEDRANYDKIKIAADTEKAREEEVRKKLAELELQKHLSRLREAAEKNRKRQKEYEKQRDEIQKDINKDPNSMQDCIEKYQRIVERAKQGKGKFSDSDFRADQSCLTGGKQGRGSVQQRGDFRRFSDDSQEDYKIFKDSAKNTEACQGAIGDCYFVAAIAALGNKRVKERFYFFENEDEWKTCGAFCVKFGPKDNEHWIVIDDYFLVQTCGPYQRWGDGSTGDRFQFMQPKDGEIWACVLEKAYAKMNDGYGNIEGGNVHLALEELIGGQAVCVSLQYEVRDKNSFYEEVKEIIAKGYPIGCASHQGSRNDHDAPASGIPFRHAYTVVDLKMLDQNKLICIRNPWGKLSQKQDGTKIGEYNGDWSDSSPLWTERFKNMVNFEKAEDGIWWMEIGDFVEEFSQLQYCIPPSNE